MGRMQLTVTAVVVSYNRADLLRECLDGIAAQTWRPERVIVVDNASTDGAAEVARTHRVGAEVIELPRNVGGAGGFCAGLAEAIARFGGKAEAVAQSHHYVWLMDDDTVPTPGALSELIDLTERAVTENRAMPAVLGSRAVWTDGREHLMNRPRPRTWVRKGAKRVGDAYQARSMSFVSCLINAGAVLALGRLPRAAYFLWNDDFEFTTALLRRGVGYYVPSSEVVHKTKTFGSSDADPGARFYDEVRNKLWLFRHSRGNFTLLELAEFLLKTARRWTLTWLRASDRAQIADCLRRGWHDGMHTDPEPNAAVFQDMPEVAEAVAAVEGDGRQGD